MVGGTTPPQSDSREISRVLVLNLSGKASGAHAPPRRGLSLTTPSLLSMGTREVAQGEYRLGRLRSHDALRLSCDLHYLFCATVGQVDEENLLALVAYKTNAIGAPPAGCAQRPQGEISMRKPQAAVRNRLTASAHCGGSPALAFTSPG